MKKNFFYITYIVGVLLSCFLLFATMFVKNENIVTELNSEVTSNDNSLAENSDSYLSKNFGFRSEILSIYTSIQRSLFFTSPIENVIVGKDGYLFYKETADDYCGTNVLGKREIYNINKTLELMQEYVENQGGQMLFVVAPNKNSLYDYMPYYYVKSESQSNWDLLKAEMHNVNYLDAFTLFENYEEELYYKTDSHWNDLGAYYVYVESMDLLKKEYKDRLSRGYLEECSMIGDLQRMLYPTTDANEMKMVFNEKSTYNFLTNTRNFEQSYIESYNEAASGSLLMFRDSFANNLIDHYSNTYEYAIYDKSVPYDLTQMDIYKSDTVILEIAERNLELIQISMPNFLAPIREDIVGKKTSGLVDSLEFVKEDSFVKISGSINEKYTDINSCFYVKVNNSVYELTPQKIDDSLYGLMGYLPNEMRDGVIEILVVTDENIYCEEKQVPNDIVENAKIEGEETDTSNVETDEEIIVEEKTEESIQETDVERNEVTSENMQAEKEKDWVGDLQIAKSSSQILIIQAKGSRGTLSLYNKLEDETWKEILSTSSYIGRNGLGKTKEGDGKTPVGRFSITKAFGILTNPGCRLNYLQVDDSYYWVDDSNSIYYNQFVSTNDVEQDWTSAEHIINLDPAYNYVLALDYNSENIPGKGSAIFIHCEIGKATSGCISIPESDMICLMQNIMPGCVVIIDSVDGVHKY